MFEWVMNYIEPLVMVLIFFLGIRIWSATELKKKEIEEDGKAQRSKINCDSKDAQTRLNVMSDLRALSDDDGEDNELAQMEALMNIMTPKQPGTGQGEIAVIQELEQFAKTPDGAQAMAQFNEFQKNKTEV